MTSIEFRTYCVVYFISNGLIFDVDLANSHINISTSAKCIS